MTLLLAPAPDAAVQTPAPTPVTTPVRRIARAPHTSALPPEDAARAALADAFARHRTASAAHRVVVMGLNERLDRVAASRPLHRAVMVIDDDPAALCALIAYLAPIGCPLHAVTLDEGAAPTLRGLGAEAHVVRRSSDAVELWRKLRTAVVVTDVRLEGANCGASDIAAVLPRGPRIVLVTSHTEARESVERVGRMVQADAVMRTGGDAWGERLVETVRAALSDVAPGR